MSNLRGVRTIFLKHSSVCPYVLPLKLEPLQTEASTPQDSQHPSHQTTKSFEDRPSPQNQIYQRPTSRLHTQKANLVRSLPSPFRTPKSLPITPKPTFLKAQPSAELTAATRNTSPSTLSTKPRHSSDHADTDHAGEEIPRANM